MDLEWKSSAGRRRNAVSEGFSQMKVALPVSNDDIGQRCLNLNPEIVSLRIVCWGRRIVAPLRTARA